MGARRLRLFGICAYQGHCSVGVAGDREVRAELYTSQSLYRWFIGCFRNRETREKPHGKERRTCSVVAFSADSEGFRLFVQTLVTISRRKAFDIVRLQVYTRGDTECTAINFSLNQYFILLD